MKVMTALLKYDYGIEKRGESLEKKAFLPAIEKISEEVYPFWLEDNGFPNSLDSLQKKLIDFADEKKPDIIFFILMKDEVYPETLKELKENYYTVNWFCDDQWRFESFSRKIAPLLSYSITVDKYSVSKYRKVGCQNVLLSQWAPFEYVSGLDFSKVKYKYEVSFIGGKNRTREWIVNELKNAGFKVDCFGAGWSNGRISYEQMKDIFLNSKINLNLSNSVPYDIRFLKNSKYFKKDSFIKKVKSWILFPYELFIKVKKLIFADKKVEQIKARNFEIPACGGFQLANYILGLEDYYSIGKEIAIYSSVDDLKKQIEYYLENETKRESIRTKGYKKSEDFTYEQYLQACFKAMKS